MRIKKLYLIIVLLISFCLCGCKNISNSSLKSMEPVSDNYGESKKYGNDISEENSDIATECNNEQKNELLIKTGKDEIDEYANEIIKIDSDEIIGNIECLETDICYRVSIDKLKDDKYIRECDYFFVKDNDIKWFCAYYDNFSCYAKLEIEVFSDCDYAASYEDVSFDGIKDIVISLGFNGDSKMSCAYIYSKDGFKYAESFRRIRDYSLNQAEKTISDCNNNKYVFEDKYTLSNGEFYFVYKDEIEEPEFKEVVDRVVQINEGEEIARKHWVADGIVYRVLICQNADYNAPYFSRDYFFIKQDNIIWFEVDYSQSKKPGDPRYGGEVCSYLADYTDVTFDGNKDIIISLGIGGTSAAEVHCAYVYENGCYIYKQSFENIPSYSINSKERYIKGWAFDGPNYIEYRAIYDGDEFVITNIEKQLAY